MKTTIRFRGGIEKLEKAIMTGASIKIIHAEGCTIDWAAITAEQVVGAAWLNKGQPLIEAIATIRSMAHDVLESKKETAEVEIVETENKEQTTAEKPKTKEPKKVSKIDAETQRINLEIKYGKSIYGYQLSDLGKIIKVTIKCTDCGEMREINTQDLFQVSKCKTCNKKRGQK